jgi:hypothetical protein
MIWRAIPSLEGRYEASDSGDIRHVVNHKVRRARRNRYGYLQMNFALNDGTGKNKTLLVHKLIAETFIENPDNLPYINHIDGDKTNNCVDNLEWCTASENSRHAYDTGLAANKKGSLSPLAKFTNEQVKEIRNLYSKGASETSLAILLGVAQSTIGKIARGERYADN